jgi:hypothetical protein
LPEQKFLPAIEILNFQSWKKCGIDGHSRIFYIWPEEIAVYRNDELLRHTAADFLGAGVFEASILI